MSVSTVQEGSKVYRTMQVGTASPAKLVWFMFDGAARFCAQAQRAAAAGDFEGAHRHIVRAQDIVDELDAALDPRAGEVARSLEKLYAFARSRLLEANLRKDPELLGVLAGLFAELRSTWEEAMRTAPGASG